MSDPAATDTPADVRRRARMARDWLGDDISPAVRQVMAAFPRHALVPPGARAAAYSDHALPIGQGQTISQPRVVACMLSALSVAPGSRVLDVGFGSGYAAALLALLAGPGGVVHAIERHAELVQHNQHRVLALLRGQPAAPLHVHVGDGALGWPAAAPFDVIHVACAAAELPPALGGQLAPGGRLVAPLGPAGGDQRLVLLRRQADGSLAQTTLLDVRFVPML